MRKLEKRKQKNMGLQPLNMKLDISRNGCKKIPNIIMGCNPLPTMGAIEEVDLHGV
jgi:hypothetical protein